MVEYDKKLSTNNRKYFVGELFSSPSPPKAWIEDVRNDIMTTSFFSVGILDKYQTTG